MCDTQSVLLVKFSNKYFSVQGLFCYLLPIVFIIATFACFSNASCMNEQTHRNIVLVSTLDGKLTALNAADDGSTLWNFERDKSPLLSSTMDKIQVEHRGLLYRLVPSLDGRLFKVTRTNVNLDIETLPVTADSLLSSSVQLSDTDFVVGSKKSMTYAIDADTGKIQYSCDDDGCQKFANSDGKDLFIINRQTKVIRSIEKKSGLEKWNFSVGEYNIAFNMHNIGSSRLEEKLEEVQRDNDWEADKEWLDEKDDFGHDASCPHVWDSDESLSKYLESYHLNFNMADHSVTAYSSDRSMKLWGKKFDSEIAAAWQLVDGTWKQLDLFEPLIRDLTFNDRQNEQPPPFYLGQHNGQSFVQTVLGAEMTSVDNYPASADRPLLQKEYSTQQIGWAPMPYDDDNDDDDYNGHEDFPLNEYSDVQHLINNFSMPGASQSDLVDSLYFYWREVLGLTVATGILVHFLTKRCIGRQPGEVQHAMAPVAPVVTAHVEEVDEKFYQSRYYTDFVQQTCLGQGGFGKVFKAEHRIDGCSYAIKRIPLTNCEKAKEKVSREVRALANLEHPGIVRYYNAWFENPPVGWQELKDREMFVCSSDSSYTAEKSKSAFNATETSPKSWIKFIPFIKSPTDGGDSKTQNGLKRAGSSRGFLPHISSAESASLTCQSSEHTEQQGSSTEESFIPNNVPFFNMRICNGEKKYSDSLSIVFEHTQGNQNSNVESDSGLCQEKGRGISKSGGKIRSRKIKKSTKSEALSSKSYRKESSTPTSSNSLYLYIQMQLCQQNSLKRWLANNTLNRNRDQLLDIFYQIVQAVHYVHDSGLMHRDLKPSNIFFSLEGTIKIGDFGLATPLEDETKMSHCQFFTYDKTHTSQVGTWLYMSPEQINGKSYCHKVDIFAMGLILFELFFPFSTEMERTRTLQDARNLKFPARYTKELPKECTFVEKLLHPIPEERPSTQDILDDEILKIQNSNASTYNSSHYPRVRTYSSSSSSTSGV